MTERATGEGLVEYLDLMRRMRAECAWKASQTHESLRQYVLEEADEVAEAIDEKDWAHLCDELGDLLMQIYFHAQIAEENGEFTMDDVVANLKTKMIRRNPHVFGDLRGRTLTIDEINELWESAKVAEGLERDKDRSRWAG